MTKAYKNATYLGSRHARPLRILAEYMEPDDRFSQHEIERALIFFGSARLKPGKSDTPDGVDYYEAARELAYRIAHWSKLTHAARDRIYICTGGGPGIMEAANRGAHRAAHELSIGLNISLPHEQGSNPYVESHLQFEFHYFFMRKFWFMNLACGLVIFPGGFGTLDELFEVLTLIQTGKARDMPVVLFGERFWKRLLDFELLVEQGLIDREDVTRLRITSSLDEAADYLKQRLCTPPAAVP